MTKVCELAIANARGYRRLEEAKETIRAQSLRDELTGLHNRRGFLTLAEQQRRIAARSKRPLALVFADLDGLKGINDNLGHSAGDKAITETAELLSATFRESDIVARMGGDEFVVLQIDALPQDIRATLARLESSIAERNALPGREYSLGISAGVAHYDPAAPRSLDELLAEADRLMYQEKERRRQTR